MHFIEKTVLLDLLENLIITNSLYIYLTSMLYFENGM